MGWATDTHTLLGSATPFFNPTSPLNPTCITNQVQELAFFLVTETERPTGSCLVVYKDGTLAQGFVPSYDFRIQYALEHHGVFCYSMTPEPTAQALAVSVWGGGGRWVAWRMRGSVWVGVGTSAFYIKAHQQNINICIKNTCF